MIDNLHKLLKIAAGLLISSKEVIYKFDEPKRFVAYYELENEEKTLKSADSFLEYLKRQAG